MIIVIRERVGPPSGSVYGAAFNPQPRVEPAATRHRGAVRYVPATDCRPYFDDQARRFEERSG